MKYNFLVKVNHFKNNCPQVFTYLHFLQQPELSRTAHCFQELSFKFFSSSSFGRGSLKHKTVITQHALTCLYGGIAIFSQQPLYAPFNSVSSRTVSKVIISLLGIFEDHQLIPHHVATVSYNETTGWFIVAFQSLK